jgi:SAM-dependent methyltransferase
MHKTALDNAQRFYDTYCKEGVEDKKILDVGSLDVNGSLKPIFQKGQYVGLDLRPGPNVDLLGSPEEIPLPTGTIDIVISSSCFEHDDMFWVTFSEMCRVTKPGGYIYVQAPSEGPYHAHPGDNWRFYADSWKALAKWAKHQGYPVEVLESYIDQTPDCWWKDSVGIFRRVHA